MCHLLLRGFQFFTFHILLEPRANLSVRRHISVFYFFVIFTGVMRREKGGKRGKKKMEERQRQEEREKEGGELEEMIEERT